MKKRILSALLILCTVLCLVPAAVLAAQGTKEVSSADELTSAAADGTVNTIRLAADIDISASLTVARKVTLDLNGHTLRYQNAAVSGSVIIVSSGAELTVTDSSATTENPAGNGKISGGTGTNRVGPDIGGSYERLYGGGILIDDGTVNMTAGNITDSKADLGGGVAVMKGDFYMSGGTINNCDSDGPIRVSGGAIVNGSSGTVVLSGSATIRECNGREEGGAIVTFGSFTIRDEVLIEKCYGMQGAESAICNWISYNSRGKFKIEGGSIHAKVYLYGNENEKNRVNQPEISGGTFYDLVTVTGEAVISDGTFNGQVENRGGKITGGTFNNTVRNIGDTDFAQCQSGIEGGTFMKKLLMGHINIEPSPYISGGYFYGGIELDRMADMIGEIRGHTVTYMVDGKEYARQILSGNAVTVEPPYPGDKKYHTFDGWYADNDDVKFTFGGTVSSDLTLNAVWKELPAFQLRINEETNEWEYSQDHGETWTSFGVKASSGEKGDKGDKGDTGAQGEKGDTGAPGNTPFIGDNGNWWIGDTDTGVNATGNKGDKGDKGDTGAQGEKGDKGDAGTDGKDGKDGVTPILKIGTDNLWYVSHDGGITWTSLGVKATGDKGADGTDGKDGNTPFIGDNGNWWIGDIDTGVNATGNKGDKGDKGDTGAQGEKGDKGDVGTDGKDGKDGVTPILKIGADNLWYVSYDNGAAWTSLGVKATGEKGDNGAQGEKGDKGEKGDAGATGAAGKDGKDGVGIAKAEINTNGELVLTYTDGNTVNVGRVVGADGKDGKDGQNASDAMANADVSPVIIVIGAVAGVSFLGNLVLLLYLALRKKNHSI